MKNILTSMRVQLFVNFFELLKSFGELLKKFFRAFSNILTSTLNFIEISPFFATINTEHQSNIDYNDKSCFVVSKVTNAPDPYILPVAKETKEFL